MLHTKKLVNYELRIAIGAENYERIKLELLVPRDLEWYYLPDDYKNPTKVRLIDINIKNSIENGVRLLAAVETEEDHNKPESSPLYSDIQPEMLFDSKDEASQFYLENKRTKNLDFGINRKGKENE